MTGGVVVTGFFLVTGRLVVTGGFSDWRSCSNRWV